MKLFTTPSWAQNSLAEELWSIAKPLGDGFRASDVTQIFTFTTPATGNLMSIQFIFYVTYSSSTSCTNSQGNKAYQNVCIDSNHANKTYYITPENLFTLYTAVTANTTACSRMRDLSNVSLSDGVNMTCTSGVSCSGSVATVSKTFGSAGSCTP